MTAPAIKCFGFEDHLIRVIMRGDEPWFIAGDICRALGIRDASEAVEKLDEDEKSPDSTRELGDERGLWLVSESGLYTIVLRSRAATTPGSLAHRFRRWVTGEVLPTLRRTGTYSLPSGGDPGAEEAEEVAPLGTHHWLSEVAMVRECRRIHGVGAAKSLWRRLKLPEPESFEPPRSDDLDSFLSEAVEVTRDPRDRLSVSALHAAYEAWAMARGVTPAPVTVFARRMPAAAAAHGFIKAKSSVSRYHGVQILPEFKPRQGGLQDQGGG